ncbi:MAG: hypothetical protein AB1941_15885 [Gemmatimonadota bacterium]
MPICIFCRGATAGTEGLAHVLPEAVIHNSATLPRGAVCDNCNQYLGSLDEMLVRTPTVAVCVQFYGFPGKRGKPRVEVGGINRQKRPDGQINMQFPVTPTGAEVAEDGKHTVHVALGPPTSFNMLKFRRALHHVALNFLAASLGEETALGSEFDAVRRYVRQPKPREAWSYAEGQVPEDRPRPIGVRWLPAGETVPVVAMDLGIQTFVVGLYPDIDLAPVAARHGLELIEAARREPQWAHLTYRES